MSRIGNAIINIPAGVTVEVANEVITVKGPKGTLTQAYDPIITLTIEGSTVKLTRANELGTTKAKHGLYRALCANMVKGVTEGFKKALIVNGVGWKVAKQGKKIVMNVGFSHPVEIEEVDGIALDCPSQTEITVTGHMIFLWLLADTYCFHYMISFVSKIVRRNTSVPLIMGHS